MFEERRRKIDLRIQQRAPHRGHEHLSRCLPVVVLHWQPNTRLLGGITLLDRERFADWQRTAVRNHDIVRRTIATIGGGVLDLAHDAHALQHLAEHDVPTVEPARLLNGDEELGTVSVLARVRHRQPAGTEVLQLEVLVGEALAVDRAATGTVALGEVTTLDHEVADHAMELAALVSFTDDRLLGQLLEVARSLRNGGTEQTDHDAAGFLASDRDVEEHLIRDFRSIGQGTGHQDTQDN
uniref:Uncharacterized protein n=1 Tax=Anopheles marajoara TaxID=58244 RepID=A0A2M4BZ72_9DIPT